MRLWGMALGIALCSSCVLKAGGDGSPSADAAATDAASIDATLDAAIDATPDVACSGIDADVVMYLTMNRPSEMTWPDLVGDNHARTAPGSSGTTTGPSDECGAAFDASSEQRLVIDHSPAFALPVGSLDLYAQVPPVGLERGIVSKDATGNATSGHLDLIFSETNQVVVRVQLDANTAGYRCSTVQTEGDWIRIGLNFGAPDLELYVDGVLAEEPMGSHNGPTPDVCGELFALGIDANVNPWLIGHSGMQSVEGSDEPAIRPLETAIDEFRLSSVRRVY